MTQVGKLTVLEAGRLVGRSKSHIFRAIKSGTLSAERDGTGTWRIDRAELARVFPPAHQPAHQGVPDNLSRHEDGAVVAQLEARLGDALDQVADLRRRLDESERERREQAARIVALLTDQRLASSTGSTVEQAPARRSWLPWRRS